jgi:diphthine synthase
LEAVRSCDEVYLETYTSLLTNTPTSTLEAFYGKRIIEADRETVESRSDTILANAKSSNVAFLVVGDPFGATTHTDLEIRARDLGIPVEKIHNASIMNAIGAAGLQLYKYGETVSIVFFTETWRPDSFYDKILSNRRSGLHTLCLLDIKTKEPTLESLARGKPVYEPPRFMTVNQAISQLLEVEEKRGEGAYGEGTTCVGVARIGAVDQVIVAGPMKRLLDVEFGGPLHSLVIAGEMHEIETEVLEKYYSVRQ